MAVPQPPQGSKREPVPPRAASLADRKWQSRADELVFDEYPRIQAVAEKWAGTIGALTGLFSIAVLVKGPQDISKLPLGFKILAGVFLGGALVAAFFSVYRAALAAQGTSRRAYLDATTLPNLYHDAAERATSHLWWSRRLAVVAVIFIILTIALTWYVPPENPTAVPVNVLVVQRSGSVECGVLRASTQGKPVLSLEVSGQPSIPLTNITTLITTTACP